MNNGLFLIFNDDTKPQQRIGELKTALSLGVAEDDELEARLYLGLAYIDLEFDTKDQPGAEASPEATEAIEQIGKAAQIDRNGSYNFFLEAHNRALLRTFDLFCAVRTDAIKKTDDIKKAIANAKEKTELFGYLPSNPMINTLLTMGNLYFESAAHKAVDGRHGEEKDFLEKARSCLLEISNSNTVSADDEGETRARDTAKHNLQLIEEKLEESKGKDKKEGCYIATACYGSYDAPELLILRQYRDERLAKNYWGRLAISFYYRCSPYLASTLKSNQALGNFIRRYLLDNIVRMLEKNEKTQGRQPLT